MSEMNQTESIQQPYTVSGITEEIRQRIEERFEWTEVRGEISSFKKAPSGHAYFRLKDATAILECVAWRNTVVRWAGLDLRDGDEVIVGGKVTVYPPRGQYQLVVSAIRLAGSGALQKQFERLKQQLFEEGLFDDNRKRPLPSFPRKIAVITSQTGAAVRDFLRTIASNRCPVDITVCPVLVQGAEAAGEVSETIQRVNNQGGFDLIVVCRGGGSLEDLWAFNEEIVVRAVAESALPVLTGIGHEIDFTLADFAADTRASTPTGAAETIADLFNRHRSRLHLFADRLIRSIGPCLEWEKKRLAVTQRALRRYHPQTAVSQWRQRLDDFSMTLIRGSRSTIRQHRTAIEEKRKTLPATADREVERKKQELKRYVQLLTSFDPARNLERGYAICRHDDGRSIVRLADVEIDDRVNVHVSDGSFRSVILKKNRTHEQE